MAAVVLSVVVRWGPVRTVVNGTLVARPARTTLAPAGSNSHRLHRRVRPIACPPLASLASRRRRRGGRHIWLGSGRLRGGGLGGVPGRRAINPAGRGKRHAATKHTTR